MEFNITADIRYHDDKDIRHLLEKLMHTVESFITAQKQFNKDTSDGIDAIVSSLGSIDGDVKGLNDKIAALTNQIDNLEPGPEIIQALDDLKADGAALSAKSQAAKDIAAALDAKTPPAPPTP